MRAFVFHPRLILFACMTELATVVRVMAAVYAECRLDGFFGRRRRGNIKRGRKLKSQLTDYFQARVKDDVAHGI